MKLYSWNVNGLRAAVRKGFIPYFEKVNAHIFALQEIKLQEGQIKLDLEGYYQYWNYAQKKGYAGTAIFSKEQAISVQYGVDGNNIDQEGRVLSLEFDDFYFVNCYSPNSQRDLKRLTYRLEWEDRLYNHIHALEKEKPVIICGDLNVAHQAIDLKNDKANKGNSGFTNEERNKLSRLLESGFIDSFRYFYPDEHDWYTWWSYMKTVRDRNIGWRIDYFIVSKQLETQLENALIHSNILGSDHCPISLIIKNK
ncbi:MAG TPA: exodeoxyribonuclease III [Pseudogracilibacillus sp.]|nr:exodeoxyribonuclease III [Pseudogracilibacillus sp.]